MLKLVPTTRAVSLARPLVPHLTKTSEPTASKPPPLLQEEQGAPRTRSTILGFRTATGLPLTGTAFLEGTTGPAWTQSYSSRSTRMRNTVLQLLCPGKKKKKASC